ncbi:MAG: hypothetical protein AAB362_00995, partial [Patescibacteria group bacterium]
MENMPNKSNPQTQKIGLDGIIEKPLKSAREIVAEKIKAMEPSQEQQERLAQFMIKKTPSESYDLEQQAEVIREEDEAMEGVRQNIPKSSATPNSETTEFNDTEKTKETSERQKPSETATKTPEQKIIQETIKEFQTLSPENKKSWLEGIAGIGFTVQEMKGKFFSSIYDGIEKKLSVKGASDA